MEASWGGKRSVAVCCCPWYWNQPAAHPVTTAIHAAFTLSRQLRCVTVYNEDHLFMYQHVAGDYQTQLVAHIGVSDLEKKKKKTASAQPFLSTKEKPHCINTSRVLVIKQKINKAQSSFGFKNNNFMFQIQMVCTELLKIILVYIIL